MELILKNKIIEAPLPDILETLRTATGNKYFNFIGKDGKEHLQVQCCWHKAGQESKPSASLYNDPNGEEVEYGFFKCFTCGKKVPLYCVVNHCFDKPERDDFGIDWLVDNFGNIIPPTRELKPLVEKKKKEKIILDESVLNDYNYIHPYMYQRKLTDDIIAKFKIGYDPETECITFPCWDKAGNLVAINRRSVNGKRFELVADVEKEIYLLNYILQGNYNKVYVCESQINALTLWKYGLPAVALLGTGCKHQYEILNKLGIRNYVLALDPDEAGRHGVLRFIKSVKNCIISICDLPNGKDVNDLTKEEFYKAPILSIPEWCNKYNKELS